MRDGKAYQPFFVAMIFFFREPKKPLETPGPSIQKQGRIQDFCEGGQLRFLAIHFCCDEFLEVQQTSTFNWGCLPEKP